MHDRIPHPNPTWLSKPFHPWANHARVVGLCNSRSHTDVQRVRHTSRMLLQFEHAWSATGYWLQSISMWLTLGSKLNQWNCGSTNCQLGTNTFAQYHSKRRVTILSTFYSWSEKHARHFTQMYKMTVEYSELDSACPKIVQTLSGL